MNIDVAHVHAEKHTHHKIECLREELAVELVLAFLAEPGHDVELADERTQQSDISDIELTIRIHEHHEVTGRRGKPGCQGGAVTSVPGVMDGSNSCIVGSEPVDDLAGLIAAAIVHDDDFEVRRIPGQDFERVLNDDFDILSFVMRR